MLGKHIALFIVILTYSLAQRIGLTISLDHFWYFVKRTHFTGYYSLSSDTQIKLEDFTKWDLFGSHFEMINNVNTVISFSIRINGADPYCPAGQDAIRSVNAVYLDTDLSAKCVNDANFKVRMDDFSLHPRFNVVHGYFTVTCTPQINNSNDETKPEAAQKKSPESLDSEKRESKETPNSLLTKVIV